MGEIKVPETSIPADIRYGLSKPALTPIEPLPEPDYKSLFEEKAEEEPSVWEVIWYVITRAPALIYNLFKLLKLMEELKMDGDKKTTWVATIKVILGIVALILGLFGKALPAEVSDAIIAIAGGGFLIFSWIQGFFTNKKEK